MKTASLIVILGLAVAIRSATADDKWNVAKLDFSKVPPAADKEGLTYANDILPLFETSCFRCHGEERQRGGLRLDSLAAALKGGKDGKIVVPGDGLKSLLIAAIAQVNEAVAMPPKRGPGGPNRNRPPGGGAPAPDGPVGPGGPGGPGGFGPPAKALTAAQVSLVRAWIDQGAK